MHVGFTLLSLANLFNPVFRCQHKGINQTEKESHENNTINIVLYNITQSYLLGIALVSTTPLFLKDYSFKPIIGCLAIPCVARGCVLLAHRIGAYVAKAEQAERKLNSVLDTTTLAVSIFAALSLTLSEFKPVKAEVVFGATFSAVSIAINILSKMQCL